MKFALVPALILWSCTVAPAQNQRRTDSLIYAIGEAGFAVIDTAVRLVEYFPEVGLTTYLGDQVVGQKKKLGTHFSTYKDSLQRTALKIFVLDHLTRTMKQLNAFDETNSINVAYRGLGHHADLLFNNTFVNEGMDFDETLLMDYHLHRVRVLLRMELMQLENQLTDLRRVVEGSLSEVRCQVDFANRIIAQFTTDQAAAFKEAKTQREEEVVNRQALERKSALVGIVPKRSIDISELTAERTQALKKKILSINGRFFISARRRWAGNRWFRQEAKNPVPLRKADDNPAPGQ